MPNNVLYYDCLVKISLLMGKYVNKKALLDDLRQGGYYRSPDSVKALSKYYQSDINVLEESFEKTRKEVNKYFDVVKSILEAEGSYDDKSTKIFVKLMKMTNDVCDFRAKVRKWSRDELKREAKEPDSSRFFSLGDFIKRYEVILENRRKRAAAKKKKAGTE